MPVRNLQQPDIMKGLLVSLLLTGLCQAVKVYLHPSPDVPSQLSLKHAGAVLSKHLNLERFEDVNAYPGEQDLLVGEGPKTGLLLTLSKEHANGVYKYPNILVCAHSHVRRCHPVIPEAYVPHQITYLSRLSFLTYTLLYRPRAPRLLIRV